MSYNMAEPKMHGDYLKEPLLRYGPLSLVDYHDKYIIAHSFSCRAPLFFYYKKSSPTRNYLGHIGIVNVGLREGHKCRGCRQGIPKKALNHLNKTASLLIG